MKNRGLRLKALIEDKRAESLLLSEACPSIIKASLASGWNDTLREASGFVRSLEDFENNLKPGW